MLILNSLLRRHNAQHSDTPLVRALLRQLSSRTLAAAATATTSTATKKKPAISQKVKFVDQLRVVARGGQGGGGSSALFGRTGHHPRAAGGNGAPGGCVVLRATRQLTGLGSIPLHVEAERGGHGGKQWMDGKRGADKVVPVPLGTMVWRLVQLRGPEADRPHGVTPVLPHPPQQQQQHEEDASHSTVSSSSTSSQHRRRLFSDQQPPQQEPSPSSGSLSQHKITITASFSPSQQQLQPLQHGCPGAAPGNNSDVGSAHETAHDQELYEELVQGRRLLTNREKLHLLQFGSLDSGHEHHHAAVASHWGEDSQVDTDSESEWEEEGSDSEAESWDETMQQQQQQAGGYWADHDELPGRQLDKQQVWSVLSAQAELLGVLEAEGQELVVATGGRGGRGNAVAPSNHQRPASKVRSDGQPGQEVLLSLQLRLMADVVLVGLPNVGKSSLIAALTGARAQVGSYAFTTLRPQLGALLSALPDEGDVAAVEHSGAAPPEHSDPAGSSSVGNGSSSGSSSNKALAVAAAAAAGDADAGLTGHKLVLADLPGLVPGAHTGKGRGIDFLKHLHKARCIALVVDMTGAAQHPDTDASSSGSTAGQQQGAFCEVPYSPEQQLEILMEELRCYDAKTMSMPMLVVANKADVLSPEAAAAVLQRLKAATDLPIVPVSAQQHLGLVRLKQSLQFLAG